MKRRSVPGKGAEEKRAWAGISGGKEFNILLKEPGRMQTPDTREQRRFCTASAASVKDSIKQRKWRKDTWLVLQV